MKIQKGDILRCGICGRLVTVNEAGRGPLVCCKKPMHKNKDAMTEESAQERMGPLAQSYYGQDVQGPGEMEDAEEEPKKGKKDYYYWKPTMSLGEYLIHLQEAGFTSYPKGWDRVSVQKFAKTLSKKMKGGPKSKGFFDKCVNKMKDKMKDPEGFCASIKDEVYASTGWRGKDKSAKEVRKDVKKAKFKVKESYLHQLYPEFLDQLINKGDIVECAACGRTVLIQTEGKGQMFCCGLPMRVITNESN
jgi:desulfoferrodoxin-like iron-binding protein